MNLCLLEFTRQTTHSSSSGMKCKHCSAPQSGPTACRPRSPGSKENAPGCFWAWLPFPPAFPGSLVTTSTAWTDSNDQGTCQRWSLITLASSDLDPSGPIPLGRKIEVCTRKTEPRSWAEKIWVTDPSLSTNAHNAKEPLGLAQLVSGSTRIGP